MKTLLSNKKAFFDYDIIEKYEAGLVLFGWEVKSLKASHGSILGSFVRIINGEAYLIDMNIPIIKGIGFANESDQTRKRKLLLKNKEILSIHTKSRDKGLSLVPLDIYLSERGLIKTTIAIVRGKKKYDKRLRVKERDTKRAIEMDRKHYNF